jgi:transcriptional regulator with XRE-family HTH domain
MLIVVDEKRLLRRRREVGARIKRARLQAALSQEGLGRLLGVKGATVSKWENAKSGIDIPIVEEIAAVVGQPLAFFTEIAYDGNGTKSGSRWVRGVPRSLFAEIAGDVEVGLSPEMRAKLRRIEEVEGPEAVAEIREILRGPWTTYAEAMIEMRWRRVPPEGDGSG